MPITVFVVGIVLGTEKFSLQYAANMVIVGVGVATASFGKHGIIAPACAKCHA